MEPGVLYNPTMKQTNLSQPSSQERWQVADLKHLKTSSIFFSSEDKYKGFSLY